jgi:4'-phosphopantetheinyl transferase
VLRQLLAQRLYREPMAVPIVTDASGKPHVDGSDLCFSVAHSNGTALYAISPGIEIGCDLEWLHSGIVSIGAADLFLSACELESLERCVKSELTERLLRYWTCKEAYLKACGTGLSVRAQRVIVSDAHPVRFLALPEGYVGAVAVSAGYRRRHTGHASAG